MSDRPLSTEVERTISDIEHVRRLIRRNGLAGLDETTPEGRAILQLSGALLDASNRQLPDVVRQEAVQIAVEAILFRRAYASLLVRAKAPSVGTTKKAEGQRAAIRLAATGHKAFTSTLQDALYMLGIEGFGMKIAPAREKTFDDILAERAERIASHGADDPAPAAGQSPVEPARPPRLPARADQPAVSVATAPERATGEGGDAPLPRDRLGADAEGDLTLDAGAGDDPVR